MWNVDTPWFDVAVVTSIFAGGGILFGRFEEHKPRWWRMLKLVLVTAIFLGLSLGVGRGVALAVLVLPLAAAVWIHARWLPKHGINGWTGEPRDKYLELVTGAVNRSND